MLITNPSYPPSPEKSRFGQSRCVLCCGDVRVRDLRTRPGRIARNVVTSPESIQCHIKGMVVQTYTLPHLPPEQPVHIALYDDVTNASDLKRALLAGDGDYEYAFIDARAVRT